MFQSAWYVMRRPGTWLPVALPVTSTPSICTEYVFESVKLVHMVTHPDVVDG